MMNAKSVDESDNIRKGYEMKYCEHTEWLNYIGSTWMTHSDKLWKGNREVYWMLIRIMTFNPSIIS